MLQYIYSPTQVGLAEWPSGTLRLEGIDVTENPEEADIFTIPGALTQLFPNRAALEKLPFFVQHEAKHVAFDCSDYEPLYNTPAMFIRCNTRTWYYKTDPNTIPWCWPVENFEECVGLQGGFKYDVSFQGWLSSEARKESVAVIQGMRQLKSDIATYTDFCGYIYDTPEGVRRRKEFRRSMKESRIALCPESISGVLPYRFFESMSAGRVPLLVGKNYVLPWADSIPYDDFTIQCADPSFAGQAALKFIQCHGDEEIQRKGAMARFYWLQYLNRDDWPRTMAEAVKRKLAA